MSFSFIMTCFTVLSMMCSLIALSFKNTSFCDYSLFTIIVLTIIIILVFITFIVLFQLIFVFFIVVILLFNLLTLISVIFFLIFATFLDKLRVVIVFQLTINLLFAIKLLIIDSLSFVLGLGRLKDWRFFVFSWFLIYHTSVNIQDFPLTIWVVVSLLLFLPIIHRLTSISKCAIWHLVGIVTHTREELLNIKLL